MKSLNSFGRQFPVMEIVCSLVCCCSLLHRPAVAQSPAAETNTDAQAPVPPNPRRDVSDLVQEARAVIDGFDANLAEPPSPDAILDLERLINEIQVADPANPWLSYLLGRAYQFSGRNGDAIDQLRQFVQTREGRIDWKAHQVLGDLFATEFPRLAQGSYQKAAELNPNEPAVLSGLANCAGRTGNLDEGIRLARLAVEADGGRNIRYSYRLARALMSRQLWDEAEKAAQRAMDLAEGRVRSSPGSRSALQNLIEQYGLLIDLVSARIRSSSNVDPELYVRLADLTGDRADVMSRLARHDQVAILETAISRTAPNTPVSLREKYAEQLADAGRIEDAIAEFERVLAENPQNDAVRVRLQALKPPVSRGDQQNHP